MNIINDYIMLGIVIEDIARDSRLKLSIINNDNPSKYQIEISPTSKSRVYNMMNIIQNPVKSSDEILSFTLNIDWDKINKLPDNYRTEATIILDKLQVSLKHLNMSNISVKDYYSGKYLEYVKKCYKHQGRKLFNK